MSFALLAGLGAAASSAAYLGGEYIKKKYPPQSDAPEFGSIVTKKLPNGTEKKYRVITATGHDTETCEKIQKLLEEKKMEQPLYHTRNKKVTQSYARDTGSVAYIGIDAEFPYKEPTYRFQSHVPYESCNTRYENSGYFPIDLDGLNDTHAYPYYGGKYPDFQVVYIEKVTPQNKVGIPASIWRALDDKSQKN